MQASKIHFIGIGGIGTSALARYFLEKGWQVSGSDLVNSEIIQSLKERGANVFIGLHKAKNLSENTERVIFSPAVKTHNPEVEKAKKLKIKCESYPEALGDLTKQYYTIAISGTHGKSTTASMIGLILIKAGLDPTVIIGTKLKKFNNSNFHMGKSKYLVIEADEWQASFLNYYPKIIVLTNIEKEHLDYYKNLKHILETYKEYISHLSKDGVLITNKDDENISTITQTTREAIPSSLGFSLKQAEAEKIRKILKVPGEHNVANALAALAVAKVLSIPDKISFQVLSKYKGSWRRFDVSRIKINDKNITLVNDYAHHPTEIKATLKSIREKYPNKKIWCVFQPHQYQRTFYLFDNFIRVFQNACRGEVSSLAPVNKLIITDIYDVAGRENKEIKKQINSQKLVEAISKDPAYTLSETGSLPALYLTKNKIITYLKKNLKGAEVVILMGAGDIYDLNLEFKS